MDIFLSYAAEQHAAAREIALALRGEGYGVFIDRSELPEGDAYNQRIREGVQAADVFVFLVSPAAVSAGRYTLTELAFAEQKWSSPAGHVLPVMIEPTEPAAIPAYLRAVVMLRPAGNVAAEVAAAVDRLLKGRPRRLARRYGLAVLALALALAGLGTWQAAGRWRVCSEAQRLADQGKLQRSAGDYATAWDSYARALAACPDSGTASAGQEALAMEWLDNIRVTQGKQTFTDVVEQVRPVLAKAAVSEPPQRAANALAHLGWADFLRSRDGMRGLDPAQYYQQALQKDPANVYAHTFWGHYLMATTGDLAGAQAHFGEALAATRERAFVRSMQVSALMWRDSAEAQHEVVRIANRMRQDAELPPRIGGEPAASRIWNIYYERLLRRHDTERFLQALSPRDHVATFEWLFPQYAASGSNRPPYLVMLAQLQEHGGQGAEALATYQTALTEMAASGSSSGSVFEAARQSVQRLRRR